MTHEIKKKLAIVSIACTIFAFAFLSFSIGMYLGSHHVEETFATITITGYDGCSVQSITFVP